MKNNIKIPLFEEFQELKGTYAEDQTPIERLKNKLNPIFGYIDIIQNTPENELTVEQIKSMFTHIDLPKAYLYLSDLQAFIDNNDL